MNKLQGSFFFSACHYRGIRDDIEEEDEQVSEPSKAFHQTHHWLERCPDQIFQKSILSGLLKLFLYSIHEGWFQDHFLVCFFVCFYFYFYFFCSAVLKCLGSIIKLLLCDEHA